MQRRDFRAVFSEIPAKDAGDGSDSTAIHQPCQRGVFAGKTDTVVGTGFERLFLLIEQIIESTGGQNDSFDKEGSVFLHVDGPFDQGKPGLPLPEFDQPGAPGVIKVNRVKELRRRTNKKTAIERYITVILYKWFTIRYDRGGGRLRNDIRTCKFAREYTC